MTVVTTTRKIDLSALGFPAVMRWNEGDETYEVEAMQDGPGLQAAVDSAPDDPTAQHQANRGVIDQAIDASLVELRSLVAAPALPDVPAGTMTTAQLSNAMRTLRNEAQATRAGAQQVADILLKTIRLVRGDFDDID